jgi:DNA-binding XRE family transcriptional regulator
VTAREELASLPLRQRIISVIAAAGQTQEVFADELGAQRETVNRWVNGWGKPGRGYRLKIPS